jgi:hypothetical protein
MFLNNIYLGHKYSPMFLRRVLIGTNCAALFTDLFLDVYATSIDYDPKTEQSLMVFKTIQNKMHWASHGETAAETIYRRVFLKMR